MKKNGFTLAETLITITILGVVAAITVPSLINKQIESANKTKVKKAMAVYEKVLNQMIIDNDIKANIGTILNDATCSKTNPYFKIVEGSNCRFKTADRVWWDITDIENPIIIIDEKYKGDELSNLQTLAKTEELEGKKIYVYGMVGKLDDSRGILRINDMAYTPGTNDGDYLAKLYGTPKTTSIVACSNDTKNSNGNYVSCTEKIEGCGDAWCEYENIYAFRTYDENGYKTSEDSGCLEDKSECYRHSIFYKDENGDDIEEINDTNSGKSCIKYKKDNCDGLDCMELITCPD